MISTKILIVDSNIAWRYATRKIISYGEDKTIDVIGECSDEIEARKYIELHPDINTILISNDTNDKKTIEKYVSNYKKIRIISYTTYSEDCYKERLLNVNCDSHIVLFGKIGEDFLNLIRLLN